MKQAHLGIIEGEACRRTLPPHFLGDGANGACFDRDERFRYTLWRRWRVRCNPKQMVAFVGLNPSTADEAKNDPTVTRCINFAKSWGFGGMVMLNLFAFRATDPKDMKAHGNPKGICNNQAVIGVGELVGQVVACWGVYGEFQARSEVIERALRNHFPTKLVHLGLTKDGHPRHPLYLAANTERTIWA